MATTFWSTAPVKEKCARSSTISNVQDVEKARRGSSATGRKSTNYRDTSADFGGRHRRRQLNLDFKWVDNIPLSGDIMDFYGKGDAAPDARFNYHFEEP